MLCTIRKRMIPNGQYSNYDICVKVKDNDGTIQKKYFTVSVYNGLTNTSTISTNSLPLGSSTTVKASGSGGKGNYTYAVYYKRKSVSDQWTVVQDYKTTAVVSIKPLKATDYDICVKVRDGSGTVEKKYFSLTVHAV